MIKMRSRMIICGDLTIIMKMMMMMAMIKIKVKRRRKNEDEEYNECENVFVCAKNEWLILPQTKVANHFHQNSPVKSKILAVLGSPFH